MPPAKDDAEIRRVPCKQHVLQSVVAARRLVPSSTGPACHDGRGP
jgi:hypothetical protein